MSWILVPVDFSSCAPLVVREAIAFARAFDAGITLLHAAEAPSGLPLVARIHPPGWSAPVTVAEWLRMDATGHLAGLQAEVTRQGVPVRARVETGRVAEVILSVAAAEPPRLIVMGTHGRSGVAHAVLGSVAETVLRGATVPVVTVRTQHRPSCPARSCATCEEGRSEGERALMAEADG